MAGAIVLGLAALLLAIAPGQAAAQSADPFRKFLEALWPDAQAMGVSRATFDSAFKGVEPDMSLPDLVMPGMLVRVFPGERFAVACTFAVEAF